MSIDKNNNGWYGKAISASINFTFEQAHKISQPKDISDLCYDLKNFVYENAIAKHVANKKFVNHLHFMFEPDGDSYADMTGTINFYIPSTITISPQNQRQYEVLNKKMNDLMAKWEQMEQNIPTMTVDEKQKYIADKALMQNERNNLEFQMKKMRSYDIDKDFDIVEVGNSIKQWMDEKEMMGFEFNADFSKIEKSGSRGSGVIRIHVVKNGTENYMQIPQMNMSNRNAISMLILLGVVSESDADIWSGQIDIKTLLYKIENLTEYGIQSATIPMQVQEGNFDGGLSEEHIKERLDDLRNLCEFGLRNNFKYIVWG